MEKFENKKKIEEQKENKNTSEESVHKEFEVDINYVNDEEKFTN